jgi:hypothetical protein
MSAMVRFALHSLLLLAPAAWAQPVVSSSQAVATDSPEGWAMRTFAGTTLMTSFGEVHRIAPWQWSAAVDLGSIPHLSEAQQQVGFGGFKNEDLNKSPVFGRLQLALGLPQGWIAELGYTPPLEIDGSRPRNLFALAVGRRVLEGDDFALSLRALGQVGDVTGDITCPARLAGVADPVQNPYGCRAPSNDTFTTDYYGIDATAGWNAGSWSWYASAGIVRTRLSVQVDAQVYDVIDRSRLTSNASLPWFTIGARYAFNEQCSLGVELLHVPLDVRRPPDFGLQSDPLSSVRVQLRFSPY